jgi:hypothetical protein
MLSSGNEAVLLLKGPDSLLDSQLKSTFITPEGGGEEVRVRFSFKARSTSRFQIVELEFEDVSEYGFYHKKFTPLHTVASLKLLQLPGGDYYISLDPDEATEDASLRDQNFVRARHLLARLNP